MIKSYTITLVDAGDGAPMSISATCEPGSIEGVRMDADVAEESRTITFPDGTWVMFKTSLDGSGGGQ